MFVFIYSFMFVWFFSQAGTLGKALLTENNEIKKKLEQLNEEKEHIESTMRLKVKGLEEFVQQNVNKGERERRERNIHSCWFNIHVSLFVYSCLFNIHCLIFMFLCLFYSFMFVFFLQKIG